MSETDIDVRLREIEDLLVVAELYGGGHARLAVVIRKLGAWVRDLEMQRRIADDRLTKLESRHIPPTEEEMRRERPRAIRNVSSAGEQKIPTDTDPTSETS